MNKNILLLAFVCLLGCSEKNESLNQIVKAFGFNEIPDSSFVMQPKAQFDSSDYTIEPKHLKKYYDHPGELGYIAQGEDYDFNSLSVIMAMAIPNGGPPLHSHGMEELHIVYEGTVEYIINEKRFTAIGPYIVKIPAGAPHAFMNRGETPINIVGILPENNTSYHEIGPNPLLKK
ncbi:cupin domain-containing protein [Marivirga salinae]|uniref:Cupin domain-containing protein n=1 Tax=Marivirga salinarum TaxID=3059078 RepID=A0AA51NA07_9BACT|nr:cupin domain-containing protein [Marivirga sp. BDSF4-3]WMN11060.1 cupin domain-containing protein [Marivirga sp. BDSF4-3]